LNKSFDNIKEQIIRIKEKSPYYGKIVDFYEEILKVQESAKDSLNIPESEPRKNLIDLQKEGFPLLNKEDFILDIHSSANVFESICKISKHANEKMSENIQIIEDAVRNKDLNIEELLKKHYDESYVKKIAEDLEIDKAILKFFTHMSIQPSLNVNVENLKNQVDLKNWLRGYCPICGSLPRISELKEEGKRYFLCSFCGFHWPGERLKCPFCNNRDHNKLHYFYEEGKEAYRIDVCDNCNRYLKTIDTRKLDYDPDLNLEDITTVHLDILADKQGYKRPAPTPWGI
jgi:FdhE protein